MKMFRNSSWRVASTKALGRQLQCRSIPLAVTAVPVSARFSSPSNPATNLHRSEISTPLENLRSMLDSLRLRCSVGSARSQHSRKPSPSDEPHTNPRRLLMHILRHDRFQSQESRNPTDGQ